MISSLLHNERIGPASKVETPYHDNNLILTSIISPQVVDNEPEVAHNYTWVVLGMEDGDF
jgi:hypothetical protein